GRARAGPRASWSASISTRSAALKRIAAPGRSPGAAKGRAGCERRPGLALEAALVLRAQPIQLLGIETHPQGESHLSQDGLDLVQRLLAEVLGLEQLRLRLLHEVGDGPDVGRLEAVGGAHGELELVDIAEEVLVELDPRRRLKSGLVVVGHRRRTLRGIREEVELV